MRPVGRLLVATLAASLVACGGGGGGVDRDDEVAAIGEDEGSTPPEAVEEPPADDEDAAGAELGVDEVPDDLAEVDVDLAQRILDELDAATGALAVHVADAGGFGSEEAEVQLRSLYTARSAADTRATWEEVLLPAMPDDPGAPVSEVTDVIGANDACVVVEAERDYSALGAGDELVGRTWTVALTPTGDGPNERNATVWQIDTEAAAQVDAPCLSEEKSDA